jgi:catechol-2,3-dioxygenase
MGSVLTELVIDAADPESLAAWWAEVLGWETIDADETGVEIGAPDGTKPTLVFVRVPEPKSVKNRIHLDVNPAGCDQDEELARLRALGAIDTDVGQGDETWHVLADPEGNEFCLLRSRVR